jgi:hypothetical protein
LNNAIQQTPHRQELRTQVVELGLLESRQFLPAAGWRNARSETVQEMADLRQVKSTGLRKPDTCWETILAAAVKLRLPKAHSQFCAAHAVGSKRVPGRINLPVKLHV